MDCENWAINKAECQRIDAFELWCPRRLFSVPWTARRSNQSILKEISPEYSSEELLLKMKLQDFGHLMWRTDSNAFLFMACSAFFMVQLWHPYMTTGKAIALIRWTFVSKVMSLLFNMLSRLVIAFLPRSKCLLISWLQLTICSDFGAQENKVCHCFHCFAIYLPWSDGTRCHDPSILNVEF